MSSKAKTYAAFISYRHLPKDTATAKRVQKAIECYRLPRGVRAKSRVQAHPERTLGRCFRDEDELAASHSLPDHIKDALARSRMLVVICTPDTAGSLWVQREIAEFIQLHGPERVVPVLAAGSSSESIPDILRQRDTVIVDGKEHEVIASPLAADLRSKSAREQKAELLRIIAAVAGCDYDDLRQRQRTRKRKLIALGCASTLLMVGLIAALAIRALTPSEDQLIAESKDLAAQAQQQLAAGDRMGAIRTALLALPDPIADNARPLVPEAQSALEDAVQVNPDPQNIWRPSFMLEVPGAIVSFTASTEGNWAAVLDDMGCISVFDLRSGNKRFELSLHAFGYEEDELGTESSSDVDEADDNATRIESEWLLVAAGADNLIIANRTGAGNLACVDARTGNTRWREENVTASSIALSPDGSRIAVFSIFEGESFMVGLLDAATGNVIDWEEFEDPGFLEWPIFLPSYYDAEAGRAYLGIAGFVAWVDLPNDAIGGVKLNDYVVQSLKGDEGIVIAASSYRGDGSGHDQEYAVDGVSGETIEWTQGGVYDIDLVGARYGTSVVNGRPRVADIVKFDGKAALFTVGRKANLVRLETGEIVASKELANSVVGIGTGYMDDEHDMFYVATADGSLDIWIPSLAIENGRTMRTSLPCEIDEASIQWYGGRDLLALLKSAQETKKLMVYRLDSRPPDEVVDTTLDSLVSEAREILAANETNEGNVGLVNQPEAYLS